MFEPGVEVDPKNHVASVVKAVRLLELFTDGEPSLSFGQLVELSGFSRTTTHRLLGTLELVGWVDRSGDRYRLALRVFRLGSTAVSGIQLRHEASHVMSELAAEHGEDVYLVVPDGPRAVCLERIEGRTPVHVMVLDIGKSLPLFVGGGPVALLTARENDLLPALLASGPCVAPDGHVVSHDEIRRRIDETRSLGYSRSMEDVTQGVGAFGAAIRNAQGFAIGAISLGALKSTLEEREAELSTALVAAADRISARMGWVPPS
ncbi:IclR family transcriptional regulator [Nocardioides sambongensis]|uniref:IclR family transcriptional regulator n=1 Tax=Nocardioides sambongensis TaxID=2589074 RepID=UPI00112E1531|nr:IclR family transcriptional regulator [Nocardioides sambongensis]